jgi:transcription termination/antitermination protein NusG
MTPFERGDRVRINDGVFACFTGVVTDVDARRRTLTVSVAFFDRALSMGFDFMQVRKVA